MSPSTPARRRHLLVVTTSFAPENAIGSVRLVKLTKYLVRLGYSITVISPELDESTLRDETLECEELTQTVRITVPQSRWFRILFFSRRKKLLSRQPAVQLLSDSRTGVASRAKTRLFRFAHLCYTLLRNWDWKRQVIRSFRDQLLDYRFDAVVSSYPSLGAMWAASWLRNRGRVPLWVADFRDPVDYERNSIGISRFVYSRIQRKIVAAADVVTAVSKGIAAKLDDPPQGTRPIVLYNGFDSEDCDLSDIRNTDREYDRALRFAYVGSLYGGERDISVIFDALKDLLENGRIRANRLQFSYAGNDFRVLREQASRFGQQSILVDHGRVTRKEALGIQGMADIVVVSTWNTEQDQGVIPGKLFECFMLRKPILGVVGGEKPCSEFKSLVERVGAGFVYEEAGDRSGQSRYLRQYLEEMDAQLRTAGEVRDAYNYRVLDYAYQSHAKTISRLIGGCEAGD